MMLEGKIILAVGGAQGIGRATAKLCSVRGANVIIADIDAAAGTQTASEIGSAFIMVNVADETSVQNMISLINRTYGRLDVLIQTAGILSGAFTHLDEFSVETFRAVLDVNITGSFLCVKHCVQLMKKAGGGVVILTSSDAAISGSPSYAFGTSKGGVSSFAISLAHMLEQDNIRVNVIAPGNIDTGMKRSLLAIDAERRGANFEQVVREAKLGTPDGVAKVIAWLASDDANYVRGIINTR